MRKDFVNENKKIKVMKSGERGSAVVISLLVMVLLLGFVALAVTRTTNETIASSNDASESRTFEASQASLEVMTRNFDKIFDIKLHPDTADMTRIKGQKPPGFETDYDFLQNIRQTKVTERVVLDDGEYQGLTAMRDEWTLDTTATDSTDGVQVALQRKFFNNRIPIFQFGIFYDDDLEFHPGPRFDFGGRVHTNGSLFLMAGTGLYFSSKVTATGQIFTDVARNGFPWTKWNENVFVRNASGNYVQVKHDMGSVLKTPVIGSPVFTDPDMPTVYKNADWNNNAALFDNNLLTIPEPFVLPIRIAASLGGGPPLDYIEMVRRGKNVGDMLNNTTPVTTATADGEITKNERYYNKTGIRVSLADSKVKLPGCSSGVLAVPVTIKCGVLLNAHSDGQTTVAGVDGAGYRPRAMTGTPGYQATEINGARFAAGGRQIWIKIEAVGVNPTTNVYAVRDITEDILSLGVTEAPPQNGTDFTVQGYNGCAASNENKDCRSVFKLQRFVVPGAKFAQDADRFMTSSIILGTDYNYVLAKHYNDTTKNDDGITILPTAHRKAATINTKAGNEIVAFPINMFDTREGLYNDDIDTDDVYDDEVVPWNGVMSLIDLDVANLKRFLDGDYDGEMPTTTKFAIAAGRGLRSTDIPNANGWVLYISDRRGDADFDGEYDMEDIYGDNDNVLQPGEDINKNLSLDRDYGNEAPRYTKDGLFSSVFTPNSYAAPTVAASVEHKFYRRAVRLINGETLPGVYNAATPADTRGFTVASENGVYVKGNYNAFGIASIGEPTPATDYLPYDTSSHIPASVVADAVSILSNNWNDANSFKFPFDLSKRKSSETFIRFAMISGDARTSKNGTPNQGGGDPRMTGGVHNFKRFLESWGGKRLNYAGSLINLYNAHNNNGAFKCCRNVYTPPIRNWVFDTTFLDINRLPPGTPFFQSIQLTGFHRLN